MMQRTTNSDITGIMMKKYFVKTRTKLTVVWTGNPRKTESATNKVAKRERISKTEVGMVAPRVQVQIIRHVDILLTEGIIKRSSWFAIFTRLRCEHLNSSSLICIAIVGNELMLRALSLNFYYFAIDRFYFSSKNLSRVNRSHLCNISGIKSGQQPTLSAQPLQNSNQHNTQCKRNIQ